MTAGGLRRVVLASFATRIGVATLGAVSGILIARALEPEGRGAYYLLVTIGTTAATLGHLSIEQAQIARWKHVHERRRLIDAVPVAAVVLGSAAGAIAFLTPLLLGHERLPVHSALGLTLAAATAPIALLALYANSLVALDGQMGRYNQGLITAAVVQLLVLLILFNVGQLTVLAVIGTWMLATAVPLLLTLPALRPRPTRASLVVVADLARHGLRYHVGVASLFLLFRVDVFLVNGMRSTYELGLYSLAVTLAELVYLVSDSVAQAIVSRQATGRDAEAVAVTQQAVRVTLLGGLAMTGALAVTAPVLVPLLYGVGFADAVPTFLLLLPGVLAFACGRPIAALLTRLDRPRVVSGLSTGALALNVTLGLALIPGLGINGAAAASSISYAAVCGGWLLAAVRIAGAPPRLFLPHVEDLRVMTRTLRGRG